MDINGDGNDFYLTESSCSHLLSMSDVIASNSSLTSHSGVSGDTMRIGATCSVQKNIFLFDWTSCSSPLAIVLPGGDGTKVN